MLSFQGHVCRPGVCYSVSPIITCCSFQRLVQHLWITGCLHYWIVFTVIFLYQLGSLCQWPFITIGLFGHWPFWPLAFLAIGLLSIGQMNFNFAYSSLAGGEPMIGLDAFIKYPWFDEYYGAQLFPFKTMAMISSMISLLVVSQLTRYTTYANLSSA